MGIKTGMRPADVVRIAKTELGQTLLFNESTGILSSPATDCEFDFLPDGTAPPLGRRCFVGTFLKPAAGSDWVLAKFRLTQTHATELGRQMGNALRAKYGASDLSQAYPGRVAPMALQSVMQTIPTYAAGWVARLSAARPDADDVPFPLHPLELFAETVQGTTVMSLTVTDRTALNATAAARAAEAKRASERSAPKF